MSMEKAFEEILRAIGEDPEREGLLKTPQRCARAYAELTRGYSQDAGAIINGALFTEDYSEMIIMKDIDFFSLCEHHMLPFFGKAHLAYLPKGKIVGISKLARLVDVFARPSRKGSPSWSRRTTSACACAASRSRTPTS
jgi:GTP cyclohydrolase I